jgi:hypothetical protein
MDRRLRCQMLGRVDFSGSGVYEEGTGVAGIWGTGLRIVVGSDPRSNEF